MFFFSFYLSSSFFKSYVLTWWYVCLYDIMASVCLTVILNSILRFSELDLI